MRENLPLALAALVIIFAFGIIVLFITVEVIESNSSDEKKIQQLEYFIDNATKIVKETQSTTTNEILQFLNSNSSNATRNEILHAIADASNTIKNTTQQLPFHQLWENP